MVICQQKQYIGPRDKEIVMLVQLPSSDLLGEQMDCIAHELQGALRLALVQHSILGNGNASSNQLSSSPVQGGRSVSVTRL